MGPAQEMVGPAKPPSAQKGLMTPEVKQSKHPAEAPEQPKVVIRPPDLPTALIILASILMLLVVAAILWCYKVSGPKGQPDDCVETEMWKHSDSEVDLSRAQEEESDRKCLGDITLGMDPESRMTLE
ncbi:hypothetical protein fugu_011401 [Takifugu bimaculatus]|uniref:Uncharacterized protein n=1 Tax=Takifugu bimaculatus TaxID=433685 RepID=A0A4Z2C7F5_9TELE|nr:hypothetical protein fugu_011401 [Takifugu bimaculatus]